MKTALAALALLTAIGGAPAFAANADNPNQNVDPRLDKGGDTGNSRVDSLNRSQLDENQGVRNPALGTAPPTTSTPPTPQPPR